MLRAQHLYNLTLELYKVQLQGYLDRVRGNVDTASSE
jgi:hypothetical protein